MRRRPTDLKGMLMDIRQRMGGSVAVAVVAAVVATSALFAPSPVQALGELKKAGMHVTEFTPAETAKLREKLKPTVDKFSKEFNEQTAAMMMSELQKARPKGK